MEKTALFHGLLRIEPVPIHAVPLALRPAAARAVKAANGPAPDRGSLALVRVYRGLKDKANA